MVGGGVLFIACVAVYIGGSNNGLLSNTDGKTSAVIRRCGADSVTRMTTLMVPSSVVLHEERPHIRRVAFLPAKIRIVH